MEQCPECAAALGDAQTVPCTRIVTPRTARDVAPALGVVVAVELSHRGELDVNWAEQVWRAIAPAFDGAVRTGPGPAGSIVSAWVLDAPGTLVDVAELALELRGRVARVDRGIEVRGAIALGVIGGAPGSAVERGVERLAFAAAPGRWLVVGEVARRLQSRFELRGVGLVPRWPIVLPAGHRELVAPLSAPTLPSAVSGEPSSSLLGRVAERDMLLAELARVAVGGGRRVVLVCAPAGGGKSYLLRHVLSCAAADTGIELAGVAFPPLGASPLAAVSALLAELDGRVVAADPPGRLGARLGAAAGTRAGMAGAAVVVDDVHWADPESLTALRSAIAASDRAAPLVWILSARTAALPDLADLVALADLVVTLAPLEPEHRIELLQSRLGIIPDDVRAHVAVGAQRGNPLFLEHLAALLADEPLPAQLPGSLHEAVLARLETLAARARSASRWPQLGCSPKRELEAAERELGDWLDRLETSDLAELATIGRYLGRLRWIDTELVIARSLLGMAVSSSRRLAQAIERLAAASTPALLDYLGTLVRQGRPHQAAREAAAAAHRAELALRLADAEALLAFACEHDPDEPELVSHRGDLALALGWPGEALSAYRSVASHVDAPADLERRIARAEATAGRAPTAIRRLQRATQRSHLAPDTADAYALDLARLLGTDPTVTDGGCPGSAGRRAARVKAWANVGNADDALAAARQLALDGPPAACAAGLVDTAALASLAGVSVRGLFQAAQAAAGELNSQSARALLKTADVDDARRLFLHWDS